jgi:homoserine O-acetyltransferase
MAAHITYLSETALKRKFDRKLQDRAQDVRLRRRLPDRKLSAPPGPDLRRPLRRELLSLHHPRDGLFRPRRRTRRRARQCFPRPRTRFCVFSFSSDWHYTPEENRDLVRALNAAGCETSYVSIETDKGHDAFFVEEPEFEAALLGFIDAAAQARGLPKRRDA